jgi:anthranilate phosphoribosyltransferase
VFNLELARLYAYRFQQIQVKYGIVHALDGYDEVSLTGKAKLITPQGERLINAAHFGFEQLHPDSIKGGSDVGASAKIFMKVLEGKGTDEQHQVVLANAALAIAVAQSSTLESALERAKDSLFNQKGLKAFNTLKTVSAS